MKKKINVIEALLQTMFSIGGLQKNLDTEDIALKAFKISPQSFSWKKYRDYIDLNIVKVNLYLAKKKFFISGNEKDGWMLTDKGLDIINASKNKSQNGFKLRTLKKDKIEQNKEISRILDSTIYINYSEFKTKPSYRQMEEIFNVDSYVIGERRKQRIKKVINLCKNNLEIYKFLKKNKQILTKQKRG